MSNNEQAFAELRERTALPHSFTIVGHSRLHLAVEQAEVAARAEFQSKATHKRAPVPGCSAPVLAARQLADARLPSALLVARDPSELGRAAREALALAAQRQHQLLG